MTNSVIVLASAVEGKVVLVCATDNAARNSGAKAGVLTKVASSILGGGGGGKDDFAQGGGTKVDAIEASFSAIADALRQ